MNLSHEDLRPFTTVIDEILGFFTRSQLFKHAVDYVKLGAMGNRDIAASPEDC